MSQFHRLYDVVDDESRAQSGSQAEKEHLAALVAAQRLHRSIVHELDLTTEGLLIVEAGPARAEVTWLRNRTTMEHRTWEAYRDRVVRPSGGDGFDAGDHLLGRQRRPGGKLPRRVLAGGEHFHVSPTDVDDQHAHGNAQLALARAALFPAITSMRSRQELTNDLAPSSWSWLARVSTSTPAPANRA